MINTRNARTEFAQAIKAIAMERGLDPEVILEAIKQAIVAAYRRDARERGEEIAEDVAIEVELDPVTGETKIIREGKDVTPPGFGRIAAQTAKQVIHQKIREAEKTLVMDEFAGKVGGLVSGVILRFEGPNVRVDLGRSEAILPQEERVPTEKLNQGERMTFLLKEIREGIRGKELILSRADPQFVVKLFAREVPEINSKSVEIKSIVREPGIRTKMVVYSNQPGVDPVGSCVGQKGVRVQTVTSELGGERVDVIPYSDNIAEVIKNALSPAENLEVTLDEEKKIAFVLAPEDQLSLAIGRDGQNARLAAKLTGWGIKVESVESKEPKKEDKEEKEETKATEDKKIQE
ncbi:MAG: Transcription termination protein NusA [Candidatus Woesebacteria bacterium]|nr:MAG: Transcription termination protein NusA [Candidatus Woesebacteria bacterium]